MIYTMAIGGTYSLPTVPHVTGVDYVCFTDQHISDPKGWALRSVDLLLPGDSFRSSRDFKIRPHRHFSSKARSIYIDSSVELSVDPETLWQRLMPSKNVLFGALYHSQRETVADEFDAVQRGKLDYPNVLREQRKAFAGMGPGVLDEKPVWGGLLARRHSEPTLIAVMETWFANVLRYSRRDQLSLPLALSGLESEQKNLLTCSIKRSDFHRWPASEFEKPAGYRIASRAGGLRWMANLFRPAREQRAKKR